MEYPLKPILALQGARCLSAPNCYHQRYLTRCLLGLTAKHRTLWRAPVAKLNYHDDLPVRRRSRWHGLRCCLETGD